MQFSSGEQSFAETKAFTSGLSADQSSSLRAIFGSPSEHTGKRHAQAETSPDPLYKTSDGRAAGFLELENFSDNKQHRLPSYKNMFSALPERYPSYSLRSQSIEAARREAEKPSHPTRTSSASPTRSVKSLKLRSAATSPQKPSTSPSLGRTSSAPTSRRLLQKGRLDRAATDAYPVAIDHAKLKAVFEKALPPLTDSKSLAARKQLLEAWESAEWDSREAQIRALQEAQIKEFEDGIKAKHGQAEQSISQRLSARWAVEQNSTDAAAAKVAQQGIRRSQQLAKARQREEERLTSVGSRRFDAMLGAIGHGMMRAKKDADIQADSEGPPSEGDTMSRTGSSPIRAYRAEDQPALRGSARPPGRKELAYAGHLNRVHQAILASKEPEQGADDVAATAPLEDEVLPDILVVEDGPDLEQTLLPDEAYDGAENKTVLALVAVDDATADSAAVLSADAPHQGSLEDVLASESPDYSPPQHAADLELEDNQADDGSQLLTGDTWADDNAGNYDGHTSAVDPTDAIAAEIAAMTDELLDMAIYKDPAMTAQQPLAEEDAIGAALEAKIEGLVSTTEAAKPGQLIAQELRADAEHVTDKGLESTEEAGDAENDSVVTVYKGIPVLSAIQPHSPDTARVGPQQVQNTSADASAAEQQAIANSILSGEVVLASRVDTVDPSLLHDEVTADSTTATLDDLIGSRYQPKELSRAQGSGNEDRHNAALSTAAAEVTGDASESMERGTSADAPTVASELQLAEQEEVPSLESAGGPTEERQGDIAEAIRLQAHNLAPANDTENATGPYTAADTEHEATTPPAALQGPNHEDTPSEAANTDILDSVLVNLTLVSSGDASSPADEAIPADTRISLDPQAKQEDGLTA